jgi:hypothetical protein
MEEEMETKAVVTAISFPVTLEEANNKVMQTAMTTGIATSLGLASTDVAIAKINGNTVAFRTRRLATGIDIEFNIVSKSADAGTVAKLSADVKAAASDGALVANIQKKASDAGVLVASLEAMPRTVVVTTSTVPVTITVTKQVFASPSPAPSGSFPSSARRNLPFAPIMAIGAVMLAFAQY